MLPLFLTLVAFLPPAQVAQHAPAGAPLQAKDSPDAELDALAAEFQLARALYDKRLDELRKQGEASPESKLEHPAVLFWPRVEALAQRDSVGARIWMALQFANAHPKLSGTERDMAWGVHVLAAVGAGVRTPLARELARSFTVLYLDAPPAAVDEAVGAFVKLTTERELAADALYRASIAKRRGGQVLASPKAAEFGKQLAANYADTSAGRKSRGEAEVGLAIGNLAPDFTAKDADGASFKLSDYRGKVVVLDFWGFW